MALNDIELEKRLEVGKGCKIQYWTGIAFLSTGSVPCEHFIPELYGIAEQMSDKMSFYQIDVDENPTFAEQQGVDAVPTLQIYRNGKVAAKYEGPYSREALMQRIKDLLGIKK
jgi:thioredoxin-like negative regulator of GroEL